MGTSTSTSTSISISISMKRIPPFRLHGTKKTQLIRFLQEHSLPTHGSDDDRRWRLKNFVDLWNAECDAMRPRSRDKLVNELRLREQREKVGDLMYFYPVPLCYDDVWTLQC